MTYSALTRKALEREAGFFGSFHDFAHALPDHAVTSTAGGGNIFYDELGANVEGGSTGGDNAALSGGEIEANGISEREILLRGTSTDSATDLIKVGFVSVPSSSDTDGAYFDLLNDQVVVDGTTQALSATPINLTNQRIFRVRVDNGAGETLFEIETPSGSIEASDTVSTKPVWNEQSICTIESNGADDNMIIRLARTKYLL